MPRRTAEPEEVTKAKLLESLGYGGPRDLAERVLEQERLSNPRKERIRTDKREAVRAALSRHVLMVCRRGDCQAIARQWKEQGDPRTEVAATLAEGCEVCGGSTNQRAVDEMVRACVGAGYRRVCIVGGSPNSRHELAHLVGARLELRLVDGTTARTRSHAQSDIDWADRVFLWGSTLLDHKVSELYSGPTVVQTGYRGIARLAQEVVRAASGRP